MIKEQKKKCEDIINLYNEKYNKDLEDLYHNVSELNDKERYVREALAFWDYYYDPIELIFGMFVPLSFILFQMQGCEMEFFEFWRKSTYIAKENIINMTVSLSEIFNKNMTKEEVEKLLFIKNTEEGLTDFLATEEFRDIAKYEYASDIKRIIPDLEVEFDLPLREKYESVFHIKGIGLAMVQYFDNGENKINYTIENIKKEKNMSNDEELKLNLLILGKTGVGKSSLLNALVGKPVAKTRIGKPVTQKILVYETEIDGKKVVIYDSWGMEVGKEEKWDEIIGKALKEKGVEKEIKDWFHSVTYCIQAGGYKIEDFDIKIIKQFMEEKYNVIIALTKADQINEEEEREFIKIIKEEIKKETGQEINTIIPISANPQPKRGEKEASEPFGLPEYKAAILVSWRKIFIERIPLHIIEKLKKDIKLGESNAPTKGKDKELTEKIQKHFSDILNTNIKKYVKENMQDYYKTMGNILVASKNVNLSNRELNSEFYSELHLTEEIFGEFQYLDGIEDYLAYATASIILAPIIIPAAIIEWVIVKPIEFFYYLIKGRENDIKSYISNISEEYIKKISEEEFEGEIRKIIIETMNNIEKNIPKLN